MKRLFGKIRRPSYRSQQVVDVLTRKMVDAKDIDTLLSGYLETFVEVLRVRFAGVVFCDSYHRPHIAGRHNVPTWMDAQTLESLDINEHASYGIASILPLCVAGQRIGYLVVGERRDGREIRSKELELFDVLARNLSVALLNMFRLDEIRRLAGNLEKEVDEATRQLRQSNKRLQALDATKDEFVSMASHQLRTPLTSVKGYLSMVLEGDAGEITQTQRQLLEEAFRSSERMVRLVSDFLNVSRLQTGKFVINRTAVDLSQLVAEEVANVDQVANTHKIKVSYRRPARFPILYLDDTKIRQVIMNFIDNAIYYSPDANVVKVRLSVEDGEAVLRVIDKGIGVPISAKKKLGTKFFRGDNARRQRPDGTGIGLFLAKKVIEGHGGTMIFESELDKGSTFGFRLPVAKLKLSPILDGEKA
ncbi:MAG: HAMP domain-containing histidine kinase [Candidatus Nanogingivalaceae bacterium]|jgi:sensor protein resE|nr:HAMP domain-containing histidine kinase [Candidatus Nanogingivalaceae bacterium]